MQCCWSETRKSISKTARTSETASTRRSQNPKRTPVTLTRIEPIATTTSTAPTAPAPQPRSEPTRHYYRSMHRKANSIPRANVTRTATPRIKHPQIRTRTSSPLTPTVDRHADSTRPSVTLRANAMQSSNTFKNRSLKRVRTKFNVTDNSSAPGTTRTEPPLFNPVQFPSLSLTQHVYKPNQPIIQPGYTPSQNHSQAVAPSRTIAHCPHHQPKKNSRGHVRAKHG